MGAVPCMDTACLGAELGNRARDVTNKAIVSEDVVDVDVL